MEGQNAAVQTGWFDTIKEKLGLDKLLEKLKLSQSKIIEIGLYLGVGFIFGFLLKKYATYVLVLIAIVVGFIVLQQMQIINVAINWTKVQEVFGIQQTTVQTDVFSVYWEWLKINFVIVLSFTVGFLFGLKVG